MNAGVESIETHLNSAEITAKSRSNFALAFFFLPKERREGITHFYALSRLIDDAVDDAPDLQSGRERLRFWREEIGRCYGGFPQHPVSRDMQKTIRRFQIPREYLDLLIEGCEWDLVKNRYQDYEELKAYCYRVASTIGLVCMKIFGLDGKLAEQAAEELGMALQLTNILRDVQEDARRGRIYLSQEDLQRYRLTDEDILQGKISPKLKLLFKNQADRAQYYFDLAFTKMKKLPRRPLVAAWIMGKIYHRILVEIRRRDYNVFSVKVSLPKYQKVFIGLAEGLRSFLSF